MGGLSRTKGKRGENEVAHLLTEILGVPVKRLLGQERGDTAGDLQGLPADWCAQVKRCAGLPRLGSWWLDAVADANEAKLKPALVYRVDRQGWRVLVAGSDVLPEFFEGRERHALDYTVSMSLQAFGAMVRRQGSVESQAGRGAPACQG